MQAAPRDIRGHHDPHPALAEILQHAQATVLVDVPAEHLAADAAAGEAVRHVLGRAAAVAENQHAGVGILLDVVVEHSELLVGRHHIHHLLDRGGGDVLGLHLHLDRRLHPLEREAHHILRERGAVEHGAAPVLGRQPRDDRSHVGDEAHVEHAVGLIDHEGVHLRQIDHPRAHEIEQTAGSGDQQVHRRVRDLAFLPVVIHAAVDRQRAEPAILAQRRGVFADLDHQLAGRRDHQGAGGAALLLPRLGRPEIAGQDRDQKSRGLAGAGLGLARHILAGQRVFQAQRLDRRAVLEAQIRDRVQNLAGQIEILEPLLALGRRHRKALRRPRGVFGEARRPFGLPHRAAGTPRVRIRYRTLAAAAAARLFGGRTGHGTRGRRHRRRPRLAARPRFGTASGRLPARFSPAGIRSARALTLAARSAAGLPPGGALFGCLGFGAAAFRTAPPSVARRFPLGIFRAPAGLVLMFFGGLRLLAEQFACYFFNESEWHRDKPVVENKMRTPARDARTFKRM